MLVKKQEWNSLVVKCRILEDKLVRMKDHLDTVMGELVKVKEELKTCRKIDGLPDEKPADAQKQMEEWLGGEKGDW